MKKFKVGDKVFDDLTFTEVTIVETLNSRKDSKIVNGYVVDNDYLDGVRYLWELSESKEFK